MAVVEVKATNSSSASIVRMKIHFMIESPWCGYQTCYFSSGRSVGDCKAQHIHCCNSILGFTFLARKAGTSAAARAVKISSTKATAYTEGSAGFTPNK